jgi:hypothetical protein
MMRSPEQKRRLQREADLKLEVTLDQWNDPEVKAPGGVRAEIIQRLESGDETAWCEVQMIASLPEFGLQGSASVYGVTFAEGMDGVQVDREARKIASLHKLKSRALEDLEAAVDETLTIAVELRSRYGRS